MGFQLLDCPVSRSIQHHLVFRQHLLCGVSVYVIRLEKEKQRYLGIVILRNKENFTA